jgi:hypothetical protein
MRLSKDALRQLIREEIEVPTMSPEDTAREGSIDSLIKSVSQIAKDLVDTDGKFEKRSDFIKMANDLLALRDSLKDMRK